MVDNNALVETNIICNHYSEPAQLVKMLLGGSIAYLFPNQTRQLPAHRSPCPPSSKYASGA